MISRVYMLALDDLCSAWTTRVEVRQALDEQLAKPLPYPWSEPSDVDPADPHEAARLAKYGPNPFARDDAAQQRALALTGGDL